MKQETAAKKKASQISVKKSTKIKRTYIVGKSRPRRTPMDFSNLDPVSAKINEAFVLARQEAGMSGQSFAEALELSYSYIKSVEQGRFTPSHFVVDKMAKKFKRSLDWIYGYSR